MKRERYDRERKTAGWPLLSFHSAAAVGLTGNQRLQVSEETILFSQTQHTAQPKKKKKKNGKKRRPVQIGSLFSRSPFAVVVARHQPNYNSRLKLLAIFILFIYFFKI